MSNARQIIDQALALLLQAKHPAVRYMDRLAIDPFTGVGSAFYGHVDKGTLVLDRWNGTPETARATLIKLLREGGLHARKGETYEV